MRKLRYKYNILQQFYRFCAFRNYILCFFALNQLSIYHIGNLKYLNIQTVFKTLFFYILQVLLQIEGVCSWVNVCACVRVGFVWQKNKWYLAEINCLALPTLLVHPIKHYNFMVVIVARQKYFCSFYPKIILHRYLIVCCGGIMLLVCFWGWQALPFTSTTNLYSDWLHNVCLFLLAYVFFMNLIID